MPAYTPRGTPEANIEVQNIGVPHALIGRDPEAQVVGISHDLESLLDEAREFAARNLTTSSKEHVSFDGTTMLMSCDLYGWHPLRRGERVCVVGVSDRHCAAVEAAEQAWFQFNVSVFLEALMSTRLSPVDVPPSDALEEWAA